MKILMKTTSYVVYLLIVVILLSEIIVRNSKKDESFEALDNKRYVLQNNSGYNST